MKDRSSYDTIAAYVPPNIRNAMLKVSLADKKNLTEIRLRCNMPVTYVYPDKMMFLASDGFITSLIDFDKLIIVNTADLKSTVIAMSKFSLHSVPNELKNAYFVLENGVRAGIAGVFSEVNGGGMNYFTGINFRVSRQVIDSAKPIYDRIGCSSVLICGKVNSGKTTLLRDYARICGSHVKVSVIDERNEITSVTNGEPLNDIGVFTDVIVGTSRSKGIITALRTLSPDMIVCDEISIESDVDALLSAHGSGVKLAATIHSGSYQELLKRKHIHQLLSNHVFDYCVFIDSNGRSGHIREIRRL